MEYGGESLFYLIDSRVETPFGIGSSWPEQRQIKASLLTRDTNSEKLETLHKRSLYYGNNRTIVKRE